MLQCVKEAFYVLAKVRITPRTKNPVTTGVQIVEGMHQNLDYQDTQFKILLVFIKTTKYGTNRTGGNLEERKYMHGSCKKSWFSKKLNCISHSIAMGRHIATTRGWTHVMWMKSTSKDYVVLEEVLTTYYGKPKGIGICTQGVDVTRHELLRPPL